MMSEIRHWDVYTCPGECLGRSGLWNIAPKDMRCPNCGGTVEPVRVYQQPQVEHPEGGSMKNAGHSDDWFDGYTTGFRDAGKPIGEPVDLEGGSPEYHEAHLAFARLHIVQRAVARLPILDELLAYTADVRKAEEDQHHATVERAHELLSDPEGADVLKALRVLEGTLPESADGQSRLGEISAEYIEENAKLRSEVERLLQLDRDHSRVGANLRSEILSLRRQLQAR